MSVGEGGGPAPEGLEGGGEGGEWERKKKRESGEKVRDTQGGEGVGMEGGEVASEDGEA